MSEVRWTTKNTEAQCTAMSNNQYTSAIATSLSIKKDSTVCRTRSVYVWLDIFTLRYKPTTLNMACLLSFFVYSFVNYLDKYIRNIRLSTLKLLHLFECVTVGKWIQSSTLLIFKSLIIQVWITCEYGVLADFIRLIVLKSSN